VNMITLSRYLVGFSRLQSNTRGIVLLLFVLTLLAWAIPAVLEINSISPNGIIETAILYWGGEILLYSLNCYRRKYESLRCNAVVEKCRNRNGDKFNQPIFAV